MFQTKFSMSWLASSLLVALVMVTASCGFKPLYANKERSGGKSCSNFHVNKISDFDTAGQKLQYKLEDALNLACVNSDKQYEITVNLTKGKGGSAIQKDTEITRYNISFTGSFSVKDKTTNKVVYSGTSVMTGSFAAQTSDYGTYALERDIDGKLLEEMANDITLKTSSSLLNKAKKDEDSTSKN